MPDLTDPSSEPSKFLLSLSDESRSIAVDRIDGSNVPVLVCFGGLRHGLVGPPFEFMRHTEALGVHRVFVRDLEQCWYQKGLRQSGGDVPSAAQAIKHEIDALEPGRRVYVGTSSGAFAAIMFGVLTGADEMLAFGPQASLTRFRRRLSHDNRWPDEIKKARANCSDRRHIDLVRLLKSSAGHGRVSVHFGTSDIRDAAYAKRLAPLENVFVTPHVGGHEFVRELRDAGELTPILSAALHLEP